MFDMCALKLSEWIKNSWETRSVDILFLFFFLNRIIQSYILREEAGTLSPEQMDANKVCTTISLVHTVTWLTWPKSIGQCGHVVHFMHVY